MWSSGLLRLLKVTRAGLLGLTMGGGMGKRVVPKCELKQTKVADRLVQEA